MKRWALQICVFLVLGAIVNVAVAWGCALWSDDRSNEEMFARLYEDVVMLPTDQEYLRSAGWVPSGGYCAIPSDPLHAFGVERIALYELPQRPFNWSGPMAPFLIRTRAGWPQRSCEGSHWFLGVTRGRPPLGAVGNRFSWAFPVDRELFIMGIGTVPELRAIPYGPIWPGFAINTVLYAVGGWLLFAGPFVVRRWRRIRRGLCPKCAYDLRGTATNVCPECGANR